VKPLGVRTFTFSDQEAFARVSGDWNPIHMDAVASRRMILGKPMVHGIHGLLWALDQLARELDLKGQALARLEARFIHGISLGDPVQCVLEKNGANGFSLTLKRDNANVAAIRGAMRAAPSFNSKFPGVPTLRASAALDFDQASTASGALQLSFDETPTRLLFPHCCSAFPAVQIAALLTTTRLVGMICPGLYSIYSGLNLEFTGVESPELTYSVSRADTRYSSIQLAVDGAGVKGRLDTFLRPAPQSQPSYNEVRAKIAPDEFSGWRALVIGGSRGLGEVAAKIISAGGGQVCVTYHSGSIEAANLRSDISGLSAVQYDVTGNELPGLPWPPTHLLYFATPHISSDKTHFFSPQKFAHYCRYYIDGFHHTLSALQTRGAMPEAILYPSTIFLNETTPNIAEYCAAKAAAEEMLRHLAQRFPSLRLRAPRLPRMATDQTAGFLAPFSEPPLPVMLNELRKLKSC